jgi:hypothetical protein
MCYRFTYFISWHAAELFKQVSVDSRVSHWSKFHRQRPPFLPDLEPIPTCDPIPSLMSLNLQPPPLIPLSQRSRTPSPNLPPISEYLDSDEWEDTDGQENPTPEVHFCPQSPTPPFPAISKLIYPTYCFGFVFQRPTTNTTPEIIPSTPPWITFSFHTFFFPLFRPNVPFANL